MSGTTGTSEKTVNDLLAEVLKAVNKDSVGQFVPTRVVQGVLPADGALCAYEALDALAADIAECVAKLAEQQPQAAAGSMRIILQAGEDVAEVLEYRSLVKRLEALDKQLLDAKAEADKALQAVSRQTVDWDAMARLAGLYVIDPGTVALAGQAASAAITLIAATVRTTTTEQHGNVGIGDADLLAAVAKALAGKQIEALRPSTLALRAAEWASEPGRLMARLESLETAARSLRRVMAEIDLRLAPKPPPAAPPARTVAPPDVTLSAQIEAVLADVETTPAPDPAAMDPSKAKALREAKASGDAALRAFDSAWTALPAMLPRLVRADAMDHVLAEGGLYLGLRVLVASGAVIRKETGVLWFRKVTETATGSVLATFTLLDGKGNVLGSGRTTKPVRRALPNPS